MNVPRHQELSDEAVESASIDELRAAYRSLRDHHVAETAALISRRDDLTRRRDDQLAIASVNLAKSQALIERADAIMANDQETIDRLGSENARLAEIIDFMRNHYSPIGDHRCALCVYEEGQLVRYCAVHRWSDIGARFLATRATDPADPATFGQLTDDELAAWMDAAFAYGEPMEGTYLRAVLDELLDRRGAEAIFVEIDRQFQAVDCRTCDDAGADSCEEHKLLVRQWRSARAALCDLARVYRGYLLSLNAPSGGDPRWERERSTGASAASGARERPSRSTSPRCSTGPTAPRTRSTTSWEATRKPTTSHTSRAGPLRRENRHLCGLRTRPIRCRQHRRLRPMRGLRARARSRSCSRACSALPSRPEAPRRRAASRSRPGTNARYCDEQCSKERDVTEAALPRLHRYPPEKFPLTLQLYSGTTGELLWSRTVTLDEARSLAKIEIPGYAGTEHYPVRTEILCADGMATAGGMQ